MANKARGSVSAVIDGQTYNLCLTLGALAEIEDGLGISDLEELGPAMQKMSGRKIIVLLTALLRGGGHEIDAEDVAKMRLSSEIGQTLVKAINAGFGESENPPQPAAPHKSRGGAGKK